MPPCLISPVPGVLEVEKFGRQELVERFVLSKEGSVRSLSCFNFNDGFSLYRTMTKSIIGSYLQIIAMPRNEHVRPINVLLMTLGPYSANFHDVMEALAPMKALD
jgi:hypothetical protein